MAWGLEHKVLPAAPRARRPRDRRRDAGATHNATVLIKNSFHLIKYSFHEPLLVDPIAINTIETNARGGFQSHVPFFTRPERGIPPIAGGRPWSGGGEHTAVTVPQAHKIRFLPIEFHRGFESGTKNAQRDHGSCRSTHSGEIGVLRLRKPMHFVYRLAPLRMTEG